MKIKYPSHPYKIARFDEVPIGEWFLMDFPYNEERPIIYIKISNRDYFDTKYKKLYNSIFPETKVCVFNDYTITIHSYIYREEK